MATKSADPADEGETTPFSEVTEECSDCDAETPHDVTVQLRTENTTTENPKFSREPYRVTECLVCGAVEEVRLNNA